MKMLPQLLFVIYSGLTLAPSTSSQQQEATSPTKQELPSLARSEPLPVPWNASFSDAPATLNNLTNGEPLVVSPSEQRGVNNDIGQGQSPNRSFYYGHDEAQISARDESSRDDNDLNFSLMNAPHERIQAVKSWLNSQNIMPLHHNQEEEQQDRPQQYYQSLATQQSSSVNSMQCTHKGRQYSHGQSVPIEEQPCLNCTCRRAVLQCFLRVCPPVISLEAQRKLQQSAGAENGGQRCQMVREASQCCPSLRCREATPEQRVGFEQLGSNGAPNSLAGARKSPQPGYHQASAAQQSRGPPNSDASIVSLNGDNGGDSHPDSLNRAKTTKDDEGSAMEYHLQQQQQQHNRSFAAAGQVASSSTTSATTVPAPKTTTGSSGGGNDDDHLPKLTVINGASGQRDSILLITSNPSSHHNHHQPANGTNERGIGHLASGSGSRQDYAHALMEALLETVYSSAAQLNGLNLQGSCMINGSLYVEGSAVIPEGSAICQYCYCIRQKIMCVRPKCHLIISGCTPKYSNEYACCPTSYSCSNSDQSSSAPNLLGLGGGQTRLADSSLSARQPESGAATVGLMNQQNLPSRLWAALESAMGGHIPSKLTSMDSTLLRQVDPTRSVDAGAGAAENSAANMLNLMNSPNKLAESAPADSSPVNDNTNAHSSNSAAAGPKSSATLIDEPNPTTAQQVTTSTSTTTTSPMKPSEPNELSQVISNQALATDQISGRTRDSEADDETHDDANENDNDNGQDQSQDEMSERAMARDRDASERQALAGGQPENGQQPSLSMAMANVTTTERPSSVSDFLEPMNKLGPLVVSPTAPSGCVENNRQYAIGEQIPTLESCKHCYCGLEGLKECKMIECSLKIAHNCRPITPEGHCCPIRYECPQLNGTELLATRSRYRSSETSGEGATQQPQWPTTSPAVPFSGTSQCKSDTGEDCQEVNLTASTSSGQPDDGSTSQPPSGGASVEGENIGASRDSPDVPVFKTTRLVQEENPATLYSPETHSNSLADSTTPLVVDTIATGLGDTNVSDTNGLKNESSAGLNLTEELSKFIMQIKQNNGPTIPSRGTDYSLVSPSANETSQEMMINDQHSRMVDYHSVQIQGQHLMPNHSLPTSSPVPPIIPKGMVGIPSIQVEPLNEPLTTPGARFTGDFHDDSGSQQEQRPGGQRDSRSTGVDSDNNSNYQVRSDRLPADMIGSPPPTVGGGGQSPGADQQGTNLQDYSVDYRAANNGGPMRANLTTDARSFEPPGGSLRVQGDRMTQAQGSGSMVLFDDELGTVDNSFTGVNTSSTLPQVGTISPQNATEIASNEATKPETTSDDQPTTGTPIGLEADRSTETNGWLQSISGVVRSFGRRFIGAPAAQSNAPIKPEQGRHSELLGAASGERNNSATGAAESSSLMQENKSPLQETARSSTSLFDQLFKSVSSVAPNDPAKDQSKPLVMRPLVSSASAQSATPDRASGAASSLLEPPHESPVEIVTAAEANEPEIFTQSSQIGPSEPKLVSADSQAQTNQFSRRSDISDGDDLISMASTTTSSASPRYLAPQDTSGATDMASRMFESQPDESEHPVGRRQPASAANLRIAANRMEAGNQPRAVTCYEAATNKTYQPNEIIPKNDPCKTCTCVLGEELCQTLVCPEKPGENCSEERRPGECCANYLCGSNVTQFAAANSIPSTMLQPMPQPISVKPIFMQRLMAGSTRAAGGPDLAPGARLVASESGDNNNLPAETGGRALPMLATQRAMNVDSVFGTFANGLDYQRQFPQQQLQQAARPNQIQKPLHQNFIDQMKQQNQQQHQPQIPLLQTQSLVGNRARIPIDSARQRQLPQHPIRSSDLANLLPPHLRFRPTGQPGGGSVSTNPLPAGNLLNNLDRNKVLFNSVGQRIATGPETQTNPLTWVNRNELPTVNSSPTRGQIIPNGLWGQFNPQRTGQPTAVRQQVLLPPQRSTSGPVLSNANNGQQAGANDLNSSLRRQQPQVNGLSAIQPPLQFQPRPESGASQSPVPTLPDNVLMSRMSGQQVPSDDQHQQHPAAPITGGWQPNSGPVHLAHSSTTNQPTSLTFKNPPNQSTELAAEPNLANNRQSTDSLIGIKVDDKQPAPNDDQKTLGVVTSNALTPTAGTKPLLLQSSSAAADSKFPEVDEMKITEDLIRLSPVVVVAATQAATQTELPIFSSTSGYNTSIGSTTKTTEPPMSFPPVVPEVGSKSGPTFNTPDQFFLTSTPQPSNTNLGTMESVQGFKPIVEQSREVDQRMRPLTESSDTSIPPEAPQITSQAPGMISTTTMAPMSSPQEAPLMNQPDESKSVQSGTTSGNGNSEQTESQSLSFDPLAMFRVSECNIYGRIYRVGQAIDELSDACKQCTCTQNGVDCKSKC